MVYLYESGHSEDNLYYRIVRQPKKQTKTKKIKNTKQTTVLARLRVCVGFALDTV
jgi:hypothetical protein